MKMKKGLLTMLALLSIGSSAFAQTVNVPTVMRKAGEVKEVSVVANRQGTVKIELQGGANYRDLQFDITLPEGITLADETNGGSLAIETDHAVGFATQTASGAVRFVLYSETGAKLSDAILLEIPVTVANTFTGTQPATLTNVLTSNDEATTSIAIGNGDFQFRACLLGDVNDDGSVEIGYGITEENQGKGYATEAVEAVLDWALNQSGIRQVEAETEWENRKSQRVLEKCGFSPLGIIGDEGPRFYRTV